MSSKFSNSFQVVFKKLIFLGACAPIKQRKDFEVEPQYRVKSLIQLTRELSHAILRSIPHEFHNSNVSNAVLRIGIVFVIHE